MRRKFVNAKLYGHEAVTELLVENGKITHIGTDLPQADEEVNLNGKLVLPPYVDPHLHLDYVYTGRNDGGKIKSGTLFEGIARWHEIKKSQTVEDIKERALAAIREEMSQG